MMITLAEDLFRIAKTLEGKDAQIVGNAGTTIEDMAEAMDQGWVFVEKGDEEYPPKTLIYRGGLYTYALVE